MLVRELVLLVLSEPCVCEMVLTLLVSEMTEQAHQVQTQLAAQVLEQQIGSFRLSIPEQCRYDT